MHVNILLEFRSRMDVVIRLSVRFHNGCWSWETDRVVNAGGVTPCRCDDGRWRPLCQCQHNGGGRAGDVGKGGENHSLRFLKKSSGGGAASAAN